MAPWSHRQQCLPACVFRLRVLPPLLGRYNNHHEVIKQLEADGWYLARVKSSHHQFKHPSKPGLVTVKHPDGDIPIQTLYSIQRQAGWRK